MRERKRQFRLSLGIAVCICCFFLPLSVFAGEYVGHPAAEGSGIASAVAGPWQAGLCEPCNDHPDCDPGLQCGIPVNPGDPRLCIPDWVGPGQTYSCEASGDSGSG